MYYVEVRPELKRYGLPKLVPITDVANYTGFRSVYGYPEELAQLINERGSTRELVGRCVYSDKLFVDFDHGDGSDLLAWLYDEQIEHSVWDTGNRGLHVHIMIEPMLDPLVPQSQQAWVREHIPGADLSFYIHGGIVRLPGTVHQKTGRTKVKRQEIRSGRPLEIPLVDLPDTPVYMPTSQQLASFYQHVLRTKTEGGRRQFAWHLATLAAAEGIDFTVAFRAIMWWNTRNCKPSLPESVITERCREAYSRHRRTSQSTVVHAQAKAS